MQGHFYIVDTAPLKSCTAHTNKCSLSDVKLSNAHLSFAVPWPCWAVHRPVAVLYGDERWHRSVAVLYGDERWRGNNSRSWCNAVR